MHTRGVSGVFDELQIYVCKQYEFQPFMAADVDCEVPKNKFCNYNMKVVCCM